MNKDRVPIIPCGQIIPYVVICVLFAFQELLLFELILTKCASNVISMLPAIELWSIPAELHKEIFIECKEYLSGFKVSYNMLKIDKESLS